MEPIAAEMATAAFAISVKYCNRPYSLKISGDLTVESAIHQSAAGLGITNSDDIASLQLVHQGTKLPKQQSLKVSVWSQYVIF